jgi:serine/threonine-protein phosphatase 4 regulatory subunit 2
LTGAAPISDSNTQPLESKALGMVDEMDDPGPGHLSDRPTALTAVTELSGEHYNSQSESTSTTSTQSSQSNPSTTRPLFGSLEQRFVRSGLMGPASDGMIVEENKENTQSQ